MSWWLRSLEWCVNGSVIRRSAVIEAWLPCVRLESVFVFCTRGNICIVVSLIFAFALTLCFYRRR